MEDLDNFEEEIVSLDKPDFVSGGGVIAVTEGRKVVMPCQVNGLGGRQVHAGQPHDAGNIVSDTVDQGSWECS